MFNGSDSLEVLIMSSNFLRYVPRNLPSALYRLHLKNNMLEKIPSGAFDSLTQLRELYLQNNLLSNEGMDNETFSQLTKLEYLDLSNNNLSVVPQGLPRGLILLHLEKNNIRSIPGDALIACRNLEYLLLHNNQLRSRSIHQAAFHGLKKLHTLHMYNNQLTSIPEGALQGMSKLREIHLNHNQLKLNSIYQGAWMELSALTTLDLSSNQLSHVPSDLPESLEYLYLQSNRISTVPATAFEGTPNIKGIFLRFNHLSAHSVKESSFKHLTNLRVLDIGHLSHSDPSGSPGPPFGQEEEEEEEEIETEEVGEGFA